MDNKESLSKPQTGRSALDEREVCFLSIVPMTNLVFRRLSQDEAYHSAVAKACGDQKPGDWLTERMIEAYKKGCDVTQPEILNFSTHGIWWMLSYKGAPKYIKVSEEEFISKIEAIDSIRKQMNCLLPLILLDDEGVEGYEKEWRELKQQRQKLISEVENLIENTSKG